MSFVIILLNTIGLAIVKANNWFIVPDWCIWLCAAVLALDALRGIITYVAAKKAARKAKKGIKQYPFY